MEDRRANSRDYKHGDKMSCTFDEDAVRDERLIDD